MGEPIADLSEELPPVPPKTYRWEDIRKQKLEGRYPWTHLYKKPFDETDWEKQKDHDYEPVVPMDRRTPTPTLKVTKSEKGSNPARDIPKQEKQEKQEKQYLRIPNDIEILSSDSDEENQYEDNEDVVLQTRLDDRYFENSPSSSKDDYELSESRSVSPAAVSQRSKSRESFHDKVQSQADKLKQKFKNFKDQISKEHPVSPAVKRKQTEHSKKPAKKNKYNFRNKTKPKSESEPQTSHFSLPAAFKSRSGDKERSASPEPSTSWTNKFDFGTYPRIFKKQKSTQKAEVGAKSAPSTPLPRRSPFPQRWMQKFTDHKKESVTKEEKKEVVRSTENMQTCSATSGEDFIFVSLHEERFPEKLAKADELLIGNCDLTEEIEKEIKKVETARKFHNILRKLETDRNMSKRGKQPKHKDDSPQPVVITELADDEDVTSEQANDKPDVNFADDDTSEEDKSEKDHGISKFKEKFKTTASNIFKRKNAESDEEDAEQNDNVKRNKEQHTDTEEHDVKKERISSPETDDKIRIIKEKLKTAATSLFKHKDDSSDDNVEQTDISSNENHQKIIASNVYKHKNDRSYDDINEMNEPIDIDLTVVGVEKAETNEQTPKSEKDFGIRVFEEDKFRTTASNIFKQKNNESDDEDDLANEAATLDNKKKGIAEEPAQKSENDHGILKLKDKLKSTATNIFKYKSDDSNEDKVTNAKKDKDADVEEQTHKHSIDLGIQKFTEKLKTSATNIFKHKNEQICQLDAESLSEIFETETALNITPHEEDAAENNTNLNQLQEQIVEEPIKPIRTLPRTKKRTQSITSKQESETMDVTPQKTPRKKMKKIDSDIESRESLTAFVDSTFPDAVTLDEQRISTASQEKITSDLETTEAENVIRQLKEYEEALHQTKKYEIYCKSNTLVGLEGPIPPRRLSKTGSLQRASKENVNMFNTFPLAKPDKPRRRFHKKRRDSGSTADVKSENDLKDATIHQNIINSKQLSVSFLPLTSNIVGEPMPSYMLRETSSMIHININDRPPQPPRRKKNTKYNTMPNPKSRTKASPTLEVIHGISLNDMDLEYADDTPSAISETSRPPTREHGSTSSKDSESKYAVIEPPKERRISRRLSDFFTLPIRPRMNYILPTSYTLNHKRLPSPTRPPRSKPVKQEPVYIEENHIESRIEIELNLELATDKDDAIDLRAEDVLEKMKGRPLPPPPRPIRKQKDDDEPRNSYDYSQCKKNKKPEEIREFEDNVKQFLSTLDDKQDETKPEPINEPLCTFEQAAVQASEKAEEHANTLSEVKDVVPNQSSLGISQSDSSEDTNLNVITAQKLNVSELNVTKLSISEIESSNFITNLDSTTIHAKVKSDEGNVNVQITTPTIKPISEEHHRNITEASTREATPLSEVDAASARSRFSSMIPEVGSDEDGTALKAVRPNRRKQSAKKEDVPSTSSDDNNSQATLSELICQILKICHSSVGQAVHALVEQVIPSDREKRNEVQAAIWVITIIIAGCLMLGLQTNEKIVHHHHWDFHFPPPH